MKPLFEFDEPPGLASKSQVLEILSHLKDSLSECVLRGFMDWPKYMDIDGQSKIKNVGKAICINNFIEDWVKNEFAGKPGVEFCTKAWFSKLIIQDLLVVRFKKITDEYLVMPSRTDQGRRYFCNRHVDNIPDHLTRITVGYLPTLAEDQIADIAFTFQLSTKSLGWKQSILEDAHVHKVYPEYFADGITQVPQIPLTPLKEKSQVKEN